MSSSSGGEIDSKLGTDGGDMDACAYGARTAIGGTGIHPCTAMDLRVCEEVYVIRGMDDGEEDEE